MGDQPKKNMGIWKIIFHGLFLLYGIMGVVGKGPISPNAVLATYMIIFFGVVCNLFNIN